MCERCKKILKTKHYSCDTCSRIFKYKQTRNRHKVLACKGSREITYDEQLCVKCGRIIDKFFSCSECHRMFSYKPYSHEKKCREKKRWLLPGIDGKLDLFQLFTVYREYLTQFVQQPLHEYQRLHEQLLEIYLLIIKPTSDSDVQCSGDQ